MRSFIKTSILTFNSTIVLLLLMCNLNCHAQQSYTPREMRGVWVASVANIDWPSKPNLKKKTQKEEIIAILDNSKKLGFNAIFLQIRPASDAFYKSSYEPWSTFLNKQSASPKYDPLKYWIKEAHKRGIELHAWINPYRASMTLKNKLPKNHPAHANPEWFVEYGGKLYFNPGIPESTTHINKVVKEIVDNYNIDGIHMDDYFYPYPVRGKVFPDSVEYKKYGIAKFNNISDWRRHNVNQTIQALNTTIKKSKPWVSFGISPFGVWRNQSDDPRGSNTRAGATNYDDLYADVLLWMSNKWIDYVAPQLYWETTHTAANYTILANWWNENSYDTPIYIGHGIYKVGSDNPDWQDPKQVPMQMSINQNLPNIKGSIFFSYKHFNRDLLGFQDSLKTDLYKHVALAPVIESEKKVKNPNIRSFKTTRKNIKWTIKNKGEAPYKCLLEIIEDDELIYNCISLGKKVSTPISPSQNKRKVRLYLVNAYNQIIDIKSMEL